MKQNRSTSVIALTTALALLAGQPAFAVDKALVERLHSADAASALDIEGLKPWHLKLAIQLYDAKGLPLPDQGTIEEWWGAPKSWRVVYKTPDYSSTEVQTVTGHRLTRSVPAPPLLLRTLLDQVVHPMPTKGDVDSALPEMRKQNFGKIPLECIMLALPMKERDIQPIPLGLFPTYCFDPGKDSLRVSFNFGSEYVVRNAIGKFQGQTVATDVMVNESSLHAGSAKVVTLETSTQPIDTTIDEPDTEPVNTARVAGGVMAGSILSKQPPEYPAGARQRHVSGTVVLHAIIGRDGHVYSLHFVSLPDPDLGIAAIAAVRHWTYKPYLLNGSPTEVETTITVNFNMGPA